MTRATRAIKSGDVFDVPYPFVRDTWTAPDYGAEGYGTVDVPTWRPGIRWESGQTPDGEWSDTWADAMGGLLLSVVSVHVLPGRYAPRVFYTRQWRDPDGKVFGKGSLRIKGLSAFVALTRGYRHSFELAKAKEEATA